MNLINDVKNETYATWLTDIVNTGLSSDEKNIYTIFLKMNLINCNAISALRNEIY